jgi:hypothetical protein
MNLGSGIAGDVNHPTQTDGPSSLTGSEGPDRFRFAAGWGVDSLPDWEDGSDKPVIGGMKASDITLGSTGASGEHG